MITPQVTAEIEKELGGRITAMAPLSAANNAQIYSIDIDRKRRLVAKVAAGGLDIEAFMLKYLKTKSKLPVPEVFYSNEHVIIMQFIEGQHMLDGAGQEQAAEMLAELHGIAAAQYGFDRDTLIGALRQPNAQSEDWVTFFTHQRLFHMAQEALKESKITTQMMKQIERIAPRLPGILQDCNPPALVHGDIWSGNVIVQRGKVAAFLDPAIYYADPEVELAFIRLFNTFDEVFFKRYHEIRPIKPGFFEERADLYNIYPLLVHTRLFGASYARKVQKILDRFS
ncbi:MAG: phosphotransferase [Alphaproteobacteria bacterium]|nr:phosphotransferase [Alphaproteobacteria bacterium]